VKRKIIKIDEDKCTGCGLCIPNCHERAIQIIDGKAKLVNEVYCDGLGACLGECPEYALTLEEREAEEFDEKKVLENLVAKETAAMEDHLKKLAGSGDTEMHKGYADFLKMIQGEHAPHSCPGSAHSVITRMAEPATPQSSATTSQSELTHWPIQLHLLNPAAAFLQGKDIVLSADCVAYTVPDFHSRFLKGKSLAIACPKLDSDTDVYVEKINQMIDEAKINTLTVIMMQVPCCRGLLQIVQAALQKAKRKVPVKSIVISTGGDILSDEWL